MPLVRPQSRPFWPLLLAALGIGFVVLVLWSLDRARSPGSAPTAAYRHRGASAAKTSSWSEREWHGRFTCRNRRFQAELRDAAGLPLQGRQARLLIAAATRELRLPLTEVAAGSYEAQLPTELAGTHLAHLELVQNGRLLSRPLQLQTDAD